jgi:hypothetical protein
MNPTRQKIRPTVEKTSSVIYNLNITSQQNILAFDISELFKCSHFQTVFTEETRKVWYGITSCLILRDTGLRAKRLCIQAAIWDMRLPRWHLLMPLEPDLLQRHNVVHKLTRKPHLQCYLMIYVTRQNCFGIVRPIRNAIPKTIRHKLKLKRGDIETKRLG